MKAALILNAAELTEAVLEYLDNNAETIKVSEYAGVHVEFTHRYENNIAIFDGAIIKLEEKLVKDV